MKALHQNRSLFIYLFIARGDYFGCLMFLAAAKQVLFFEKPLIGLFHYCQI